MAFIEPGTKFLIAYGNGHELEVTALAGRKQRQLADLVKKLAAAESSGEGLDAFGYCEEALALCVGEENAAELFDSAVDAELAIDIATKTLSKQQLSEEDRKKSDLPH